MTYSQYSSRQTIETRGKTKLFSDNSQQLFVLNGNKKIYFKPPIDFPKSFSPLTKGFWGASNWDFFGAEEEGEYIKLAIRWRIDVLEHNDDMYSNDYHSFEIFTFDREGNWIAEEVNNQGVGWFSTNNSDDSARIKELFGKPLSNLEEWAWKNPELMDEYFNPEKKAGEFSGSNHNPNGRLEEWAYHKYRELYPNKPMLEGFGVREEKQTSNGDSLNQDRIYAPDKFNKKSADKITNFNPSTDTLEIDTESFGIGSSATFASGKIKKEVKKKLAKQDFDFLYDEKKGGLYFNENGADKGFGEGGIIAILKGAPDLTSDNLEFV